VQRGGKSRRNNYNIVVTAIKHCKNKNVVVILSNEERVKIISSIFSDFGLNNIEENVFSYCNNTITVGCLKKQKTPERYLL